MSDNTPTGRFDDDGGDEPTRRLPQQPDDAPTERFSPTGNDASSPPRNDAPTERFVPSASAEPSHPVVAASPRTAPARTSNAPRIALIIVGSLLAAAIAVLLLVLATRGEAPAPAPAASENATPAPSETEETEPEPEPEPAPAPAPEPESEPDPAQGARFTSFAPEDSTAVSCPDESASVPLEFAWTSEGAQAAWIGVGTDDAKANPFAEVEPSGSFSELAFDCAVESEFYTVTLDDGAGTISHATVTLLRELAQ